VSPTDSSKAFNSFLELDLGMRIFGFIHFSCILKRHYFARAMKKKLCWILEHLETVGYCLRSLHLIVTNAIIDCFFEAF